MPDNLQKDMEALAGSAPNPVRDAFINMAFKRNWKPDPAADYGYENWPDFDEMAAELEQEFGATLGMDKVNKGIAEALGALGWNDAPAKSDPANWPEYGPPEIPNEKVKKYYYQGGNDWTAQYEMVREAVRNGDLPPDEAFFILDALGKLE